jgi:alkanesulfonate monooxygenase SsuD/methylene tetrahydromethanopterin reductase-like flavin-dependent oxidoreductase (luciferase family)
MPEFGFSLDLRAPDFGTPHKRIYSQVLKMAEWGDTHGIAYTQLMEHHGSSDGYLPSPFVFAAAMAARTEKMRIMIGALLLPLHDPVRVAEDFVVADLVSGGRLSIVLGAGYNRPEFAMFKKRLEDRGRLLDEGTEIILRALSGERFEFDGREIFVRPLPLQDPYKAVLSGGGVPASAKRALRFGLGMYPMNEETARAYEEGCRQAGREPGFIYRSMGWTHIAEDPEKAWRQLLPHVSHVVNSYVQFASGTTSSSGFEHIHTAEAAKEAGIINVLTPDEAVERAKEADRRGASIVFAPVIGGLDPDIGWEMLELFHNKVLPRVRAQTAQSDALPA